MQKTSFSDLLDAKIASCPSCKSNSPLNAEDSDFCFCDDCGESAEAPHQNIFSEDFVWHPSERY